MTSAVSTATLFAIPLNAVGDIQKQLSTSETEMTTGLLANPAESLGSQFGLYEMLQAQSATLSNTQTANNIAASNLTATQDVLTSMSSDAQSFIKDVTTALSPTTSSSSITFSTLQEDAQAFLSSFTSDLNTASGGAYIFGGTNTTTAPIADYSNGPQAATEAAFQTAFGMPSSSSQVSTIPSTSMSSFLSGAFANLFTGTPWTSTWSSASSTPTSALISPGQTMPTVTSVTANDPAFQQLASAYVSIAELPVANLNSSTQQAVLQNALNVASKAVQGITNMQAQLGLSQSQITNVNNQMQTQETFINNWVSQLGGVDAYQAAASLSSLATQLETAYSLTDRIAKLGLVNYLSS